MPTGDPSPRSASGRPIGWLQCWILAALWGASAITASNMAAPLESLGFDPSSTLLSLSRSHQLGDLRLKAGVPGYEPEAPSGTWLHHAWKWPFPRPAGFTRMQRQTYSTEARLTARPGESTPRPRRENALSGPSRHIRAVCLRASGGAQPRSPRSRVSGHCFGQFTSFPLVTEVTPEQRNGDERNSWLRWRPGEPKSTSSVTLAEHGPVSLRGSTSGG